MANINTAKGFIFDCDGTLLDSLDAWDDAEAPLFSQAGPLTQEQEDEIHSAPIHRAAEIIHEKYGVGDSTEAVLAHLDGCLLPFYQSRVRALPGACELVRAIADDGIPAVVLSSSPRRYLEAGLAHVGILNCFAELVTTDEVGVSKQDFTIYERALEVLGTDAGQTWAIDDAPYALAVMARFGLHTVGVENGCSTARRSQLHANAELVVGTLSDIEIH